MTEAVQINTLLNFVDPDFMIRLGLVSALIIYTIFALFIIRQASLMTQVLHTRFSPLFKSFAVVHFFVSLVVLLVVLMLALS